MNGSTVPETVWDEPSEQTKMRWFFWSRLVNDGKKHSYAGTVSPKEKKRRRAANRVARASRRANR